MSDLVFYTNPRSRGQIVHWMLEEVGEPYETVWLDYHTNMKSPEYLAINPMGKVPALKHKDSVITEAAAICAYLAIRFPDTNLMPGTDDPALAEFCRWLFFAAGPLEMAITSNALKWEVSEELSRGVGFGSYQQALDAIESAVSSTSFICGEQFTAADVYLGMNLEFGLEFKTVEPRASFEEYVARVNQRPAKQRAKKICEDKVKESENQQ